MHMWGSNLSYHPHIHTLSTCGRLDADHNRHQKKDGFFRPGKAMARLFMGKFLYGLKELHDAGRFLYEGAAAVYRNQYEYQELLDTCYDKKLGYRYKGVFCGGRKRNALSGMVHPPFIINIICIV